MQPFAKACYSYKYRAGNQCVPRRGVVYMSRLWLHRSWKLTPSCGPLGSHNLSSKSRIPKARTTTRKTKTKRPSSPPPPALLEALAILALFSNQSAGRQCHSQGRQGVRLFPPCCPFPQANRQRGFRKSLWWMGNSDRSCSRRKVCYLAQMDRKGCSRK